MNSDTNEDTDSSILVCEIDHPLFDLIDNVTRRQVLRLIACEHNYGNRIASILDLSTPAIHRHLKYLQGKNPGELALIKIGKKTKISHSGHKGGEAQLYRIDSKIGLFFHIFPNFVHNHIIEMDEDSIKVIKQEKDVPERLKYLIPKKSDLTWTEKEGPDTILDKLMDLSEMSEKRKIKEVDKIGKEKLKATFFHLYETVQRYNNKIREMEEDLMNILSIKNDFMEAVDIILKSHNDLEYEDRVILRAITCLGKQCSSDLSHLLNLDTVMVERYVMRLQESDWIE